MVAEQGIPDYYVSGYISQPRHDGVEVLILTYGSNQSSIIQNKTDNSVLFCMLPNRDSNPNKQLQKLLSYH